MGKTEHDKAEQVHSARVWLDKAERSFRSRSEIQGELNLLLAEAEMNPQTYASYLSLRFL